MRPADCFVMAALQGLCAMFAPGNRHAIVGTKDGAIQILDIAASAVLETLEAHDGAVSSCFCLLPMHRRPHLLDESACLITLCKDGLRQHCLPVSEPSDTQCTAVKV